MFLFPSILLTNPLFSLTILLLNFLYFFCGNPTNWANASHSFTGIELSTGACEKCISGYILKEKFYLLQQLPTTTSPLKRTRDMHISPTYRGWLDWSC